MGPTAARHDVSPFADDGGVSAGQRGFPWDAAAPADDPSAEASGVGPSPSPGDTQPPVPWERAEAATELPALDEVIAGTVEVAGTFRDKDRRTRKKISRRVPRRRPVATAPAPDGLSAGGGSPVPDAPPVLDGQPALDAPPVPDDPPLPTPTRRTRSSRREGGRRAVARRGAAGALRGARSLARDVPRRRAPGVLGRRSTLIGVTGLALVAGVGAGAGLDVIGATEPETAATTAAAVAAAPEVCAPAQVAWSQAASAQVQIDLESPGTLRKGFVSARDALAEVEPPPAIAAEWATVQQYVTTVADATADADDDDAVEAAVVEALAGLDTAAMTTASEQVTAYLADDCAA